MDQLKAAMLMPEDLGPGFFIMDEGVRQDPPEVSRGLVRIGPGGGQVLVGLAVDTSRDPVAVADAVASSLTAEPTLRAVTVGDRRVADWLSPGAVAYEFTGIAGPNAVLGSLYVWRQGLVLASLMIITPLGDIIQATGVAQGRAELQRDKLAATLRADGP